MIRVANIINESAVDGPGLRLVIFAQGCPHMCKGCHNKSTWPTIGGRSVYYPEIKTLIEDSIINGVTFSGGEPFEQSEGFSYIARQIKKDFPNIDIVSYSGYTYEEIISDENKNKLLKEVDYLIDGKFILELKTFDLPFRGSSNQRIINIKK